MQEECVIRAERGLAFSFSYQTNSKRMEFILVVFVVSLGTVLAGEGDDGLPPLPPMTDAPPVTDFPPLPPLPTDPPLPPQTDPPPPQTDAPPPPPTQGPPSPTVSPGDCRDKALNCRGHLKKYCRTSWTIKNQWCRQTCGTCDEGDCKDRSSNCIYLEKFCNRGAVAIMCQRTCKICS